MPQFDDLEWCGSCGRYVRPRTETCWPVDPVWLFIILLFILIIALKAVCPEWAYEFYSGARCGGGGL